MISVFWLYYASLSITAAKFRFPDSPTIFYFGPNCSPNPIREVCLGSKAPLFHEQHSG